jgi:hypothetical protein
LDGVQDRIESQSVSAAHRTFPYRHDPPFILLQRHQHLAVTSDIARDLRLPECRTGGRNRRQVTRMAMPEAAVHEDDSAKASEYEIWPARQILPVNSKPQPARVKASPHEQFGLGVTAADAAHVERSLFGSENVDHDSATVRRRRRR